MDHADFTSKYAIAEKGLDAMEAAIGPRHKVLTNPGATIIKAATDAAAHALASLVCDAQDIASGAHEIGRILLERDTMADWTVEERAALAYEAATRKDHVAIVD